MSTAPTDADPSSMVRPEQLLRAGSTDARNVLVVWYVRRSFYPLVFLGTIGAFSTGRSTDIDWSEPNGLLGDLLSPLAGLVLAVVVRLAAGLSGLALAYPLARDRDATLEPRTGPTRGLARLLDLRQVTHAYRRLRWTHHVRQVALGRIAPRGTFMWKLDQIFDVATIALFVLVIVTGLTATI